MGSRLSIDSKSYILMQDLKDGQIALVIDNEYDEYNGVIVQRYENSGVTIGERSGKCWSNINKNTLKVRLLENGELIEIFNNR